MKTLNTDDIFLRNLSISFLDLLNSNMNITIARNDTKEEFAVPFLYNYGTDEGFLRDFYIGLPDNCQIPVAEGTYDIVPRGIITLSSFQVNSGDITNRFIRGQYTEVEKNAQDQNVLTGYSAQLYSLPLIIKFEVKMIASTINQAMKLAERMLDLNYSNRVMYFQYNGIRIPAAFHFPENETIDKKYQFTYADNNKLHVTLSVDVETYFPSFEQSSKRKSSNIMERINLRKFDENGQPISNDWIETPTIDPTSPAIPDNGLWVDGGRLNNIDEFHD
jgi:hypothetical protein